MTLFMYLLAGTVGAHLAAAIWPERALSGLRTMACGIIGGLGGYAAAADLGQLEPGVAIYLQILLIGGWTGGILVLGLASAREIIASARQEARH